MLIQICNCFLVSRQRVIVGNSKTEQKHHVNFVTTVVCVRLLRDGDAFQRKASFLVKHQKLQRHAENKCMQRISTHQEAQEKQWEQEHHERHKLD